MFATLKLQSCLYEYKNVLSELYFHQVAGESDRQRKLRERARRLIADARASTTSTTEIVSADADLTSAVSASVRNRSRSPRARDESPTGGLGKILVGHALKNDLSALMISHPRSEIRDTARYKPFMRATGRSGGKLRPRKLRDLVYEHLGMRIQVEGEAHCSIDDAKASMELYKYARSRWEKELEKGNKGKRGKK